MMKLSCALLGTLTAWCLSAPAFAGLGGDATSVEADRASMKGALHVTPGVEYDVHEIHTEAGMVVREYVSAQGKVFAVTWRGPGLPDLGHLLGSYSAQLSQTVSRPHYNHHQLRIETPEVVMQSNAYLRLRSGSAWVRALLPQSWSVKDIG